MSFVMEPKYFDGTREVLESPSGRAYLTVLRAWKAGYITLALDRPPVTATEPSLHGAPETLDQDK